MISIHALCEEGDHRTRKQAKSTKAISIHALCEEGDVGLEAYICRVGRISIHALCEEGDSASVKASSQISNYFYPRPLRGGRPVVPPTTSASL